MHAAHPETTEHFVTCFDHRFLLQGLALHESLRQHRPSSWLWVLCLDQEVETHLRRLQPDGLTTLPLDAFETPELLAARKNRCWAEYVFTLTPFTFEFVFARDPQVPRITYVDADLFFFQDPGSLFEEFDRLRRRILITEHAYSPNFAHLSQDFGRFCVQFLTVTQDGESRRIIRHWAEQCLECCSTARPGAGQPFGDQKYLDDWPERYSGAVHICPRKSEMLGPWNLDHYQNLAGGPLWPVFYHFHSFRIFHHRWVQLCAGYNPRTASHLYEAYLDCLSRQDAKLEAIGVERPVVPLNGDRLWLPRIGWRLLTRRIKLLRLPSRPSHGGTFTLNREPT